jgi:hypothetical protein
MSRLMRRMALVCAVSAAALAGTAGPASAAMEIADFGGGMLNPFTGGPGLQAGAHPDYRVAIRFPEEPGGEPGYELVKESPRTIAVALPPGLVGNPLAAASCSSQMLQARGNGNYANCPIDAQVGYAKVQLGPDIANYWDVPVFNLERPPNRPAQFGFNFLGALVRFAPRVQSGDYRIVMEANDASQARIIFGFDMTIWGVPADPAHDHQRWDPAIYWYGIASPGPRRPFLSAPTQCTGAPLTTDVKVDSWQTSGSFTAASFDTSPDGDPQVLTGCEKLGFSPSIDVTPTSRAADAPTGIDVDLRVPQNDHPDGLATSHVKDVTMTLPAGMSVSPASAAGLGACSPAEIALESDGPANCPRSSKLGTVSVETPLLEEPMTGDVILATPDDNPFGSLIALYIVAEGPGVRLKLPGRVDLNSVTGQLTATFENNPQLPFSALKVRFDRGDNASLATPTACDRYGADTQLVAWSGKTAGLASPMVIDEGCGPRGFSPAFAAGSESPVAGGTSPFSLSVGRADRTEELSTIESVELPKGLLGRVASVPLCGDGAADAGVCPAGSRIGHVQVSAGPGGSPVWVPEQGKAPTSVSLAGPYKGAPYSLSVVVPAQAGPFDLGRVVVRSPLHLDRVTTQLSTSIDVSRVYDRRGNLTQTIAGAMPTIVEGIPLRIRDLRVIVDRDGFMVNPTSCARSSVDATLKSVAGASTAVGSRFEVGECASLGFTPRLAMRLTGKGRTRTGAHPGLSTTLRQAKGQANIAKARVTLPKSVVLDPTNSTDPALVCDYDKGLAADCPASSVIGKATARTPLLGKPLTGDVHLVQGIRFGPTGNRIRTTPSLLVKLRGEVSLDLRGTTTVRDNRLVTTFGQVPDAPVSRFDIKIDGGKKGILVITRTRKAKINLCAKPNSHSAGVALDGQNGKRAGFATTVKTPCAKAKKAKGKKK